MDRRRRAVSCWRHAWEPPRTCGTHIPLATRLLSLYHVAWPILLVFCLRRVGYDRRGYALQAGFATLVLLVSRLTDPAQNVNYAFADPIFRESLGPAPVHLAMILLGLVGVVYGVTHRILAALLPPAPAGAETGAIASARPFAG